MHCPDSKKQFIKMPSLPQEIIEDILYRLPAKAIGRFRCVSKAWLAFLTQPHFILTNLKHTRKYPSQSLSHLSLSGSGVMYYVPIRIARHPFDEVPIQATKLTFPNHPNTFWHGLINSCDGLVLVYVVGYPEPLLVINPTTKAVWEVPRWEFSVDLDITEIYRLVYDEVDDEYKVFLLAYYDDDAVDVEEDEDDIGTMLVGVFSFKSGVWRRLDTTSCNPNVKPFGSQFVFVNGCIHYKATKTSSDSDSDSPACIVAAFSLRDEKFYEVPFIRELDRNDYAELHVLGGCLGIVLCHSEPNVVWVMKEFGVKESWIKLTVSDTSRPRGLYSPLCLLGEKEQMVVMQRRDSTDSQKFVIYDTQKHTRKDIEVQGIPRGLRGCVTYFESLVSPNDW